MGSIVLYIIEWAFALLVLLAIYKAAFSGTTLHRFNRFYLLGATLLSALLPLVHVTITDRTPVAAGLSIEETYFARELSGTFTFAAEPETMWADAPDLAIDTPAPERRTSLWAVMLIGTYSIYVLTLIIGWTRGIIRARRFLKGKARRRLSRTVWLVTHSEQYGPFSWMNYIVISDSENGFARRASLRHEYSHVKLLHSIDLVVLLACTIVNPVCWLVLQEIKIVHEYEADDEVINRYGIQEQDYQRLLLIKAVGAEAYALASSFNLNIKKRIIMMNKNKTRKSRLIWLLLLVPMLGVTSVLFARTEKAVNLDDKLRFTQSNVEMPYRLPEPMIDYSSGSSASTRTGSAASARTVPPPPAAVTRAEYIRVIGDDEVITDELRNDAQRKNEMIIRERNVMTIQINKNNEIYVRNGLIKRVITIDELKDLAKQFIQNPDNDSRLPVIENYDIDGYGTVMTTVRHVFSLQYDRSSSAGVCSDVRYELQKAYNELRDEVCVSKFGKVYDQCSDSQQRFARAMYANKISETQPKSYDGEGNLIKKEVKSAAGNYVLKNEKVNKDLRIRVTNNPPVRLYVSTVMFDNENGQDQFKSETTPIQISLEDLDDYIDQAISDGMKIRKVRLAIRPDVPMGPISDLKETLRNRMLLNIIQESYNKTDEYDYNEFRIIIQGDIIAGQKLKWHHKNDGSDECLASNEPRRLQLNGIGDYLDDSDIVKEKVQQVTLVIWPNAPTETVDEVKTILRKKELINIRYENPPAADSIVGPQIFPYVGEELQFEIMEDPEFPGGTEGLLEYMRKNIQYPADAREQNIVGRVLVTFIINKDGSIQEPEVVKSVHPSLDAEAVRIISSMPNWKPGIHRGKPVRTKYTLPVNFRLASVETTYVQPTWIYISPLPYTETEQYVVMYQKGETSDPSTVENLESDIKDLFNSKKEYILVPKSDENLKKVKDIIARYPDKKVNWMY